MEESYSLIIEYDSGTLILDIIDSRERNAISLLLEPYIVWDKRIEKYRAYAFLYKDIILTLHEKKIHYLDKAKNYNKKVFTNHSNITPRDYQKEALETWCHKGRYGVIKLPTGAGKTILAFLAMIKVARSTLIHVPTLNLLFQWKSSLEDFFRDDIGLLGGGHYDIKDITVTTYDSALIHVNRLGNRFGFLIFDECHHLPSENYKHAAMNSLSPFRLGLTATPVEEDDKKELIEKICGKESFSSQISELVGTTLSNYKVETIEVSMSDEELSLYESYRKKYLDFLKHSRINMGHPSGWKRFLSMSQRSRNGKEAFQSYLMQKKISYAPKEKIKSIWQILKKHSGDRMIIFTNDNETAYDIGRCYFLPVMTHKTKPKEREFILKAFKSGEYTVIVTSRVLNEGVDVPEANIAVIVSGTGSTREHVQRLGRILRPKESSKLAILYELISRKTNERHVSQRRREHDAYKGFT